MNASEMGRAFSTYGGGESGWGNLREKDPLGIRSHTWEDSNEMNQTVGGTYLIHLVQDGTSDGLL